MALQRVKVWCSSAATKICLRFGCCFGSVWGWLAWVVSVLLWVPVEPDRVCFGLVRCCSGCGLLWVAFNSCGLALDWVGSALGWAAVTKKVVPLRLGSAGVSSSFSADSPSFSVHAIDEAAEESEALDESLSDAMARVRCGSTENNPDGGALILCETSFT